jgi:SAM-dependent methyltransferase
MKAEAMACNVPEIIEPSWRRLLRKARWIRHPRQWPRLTKQKGKQWYRSLTRNGIFFEESELPMCSLPTEKILSQALAMFAPRSVLDLGCGTGRSLDLCVERGLDVVGIEGSELAISRARHRELIQRWDLTRDLDLGRKFDMLWSYEVVEHIHSRHVDALMRTMCRHSDRAVISAARPGQGGEGHFNEQLPGYWVEKFAGYGFRCDWDATELLRSLSEGHSENMLVFERRPN